MTFKVNLQNKPENIKFQNLQISSVFSSVPKFKLSLLTFIRKL